MVITALSDQLIACINDKSKLQLRYVKYNEDKYFSIPLYFHGIQGYYVFFDPWTGSEIEDTFNIYNENAKEQREQWEKELEYERTMHTTFQTVCDELSWFLKDGNKEGMTPIIHIPNIRTYAILNKKEYGGFEPMDYCPFCGAKLPERLDEKLTEILQKEYGLNSWKDYKKAPHEFQTDEWWKKRGL